MGANDLPRDRGLPDDVPARRPWPDTDGPRDPRELLDNLRMRLERLPAAHPSAPRDGARRSVATERDSPEPVQAEEVAAGGDPADHGEARVTARDPDGVERNRAGRDDAQQDRAERADDDADWVDAERHVAGQDPAGDWRMDAGDGSEPLVLDFGGTGSGEAYQPWFMSGEQGTPWFAEPTQDPGG